MWSTPDRDRHKTDTVGGTLSIRAGLPPVLRKLVNRIQAGEFVDMVELLPDRMGIATAPLFTEDKDDKQAMKSKRRQVTNILEWVQCYSIYVKIGVRTMAYRSTCVPISVDDAIQKIVTTGRRTLLAKIDIKSAFRIIQVHPADRHLLAMEWKGAIYVDTCLLFGVRSALKLFNVMADLLQWILLHQGVSCILHYLDDYRRIFEVRSSSIGILYTTAIQRRIKLSNFIHFNMI